VAVGANKVNLDKLINIGEIRKSKNQLRYENRNVIYWHIMIAEEGLLYN